MINKKCLFSSNFDFWSYLLRLTIDSLEISIVLWTKNENIKNFKFLNYYYYMILFFLLYLLVYTLGLYSLYFLEYFHHNNVYLIHLIQGRKSKNHIPKRFFLFFMNISHLLFAILFGPSSFPVYNGFFRGRPSLFNRGQLLAHLRARVQRQRFIIPCSYYTYLNYGIW